VRTGSRIQLLFASDWVLRSDWLGGWTERGDFAMACSFFAFVLLFFAVTTAVSWLGFCYIESPFLRMKPK